MISQDEADYVSHPVDGERCGICTMFRAPASCTLVRGDISARGHCRYFEADYQKLGNAEEGGHVDPKHSEPTERWIPLADPDTAADVQHVSWEAVQHDTARFEDRTVEIADLWATQAVVDSERVAHHERQYRENGTVEEPILVLELDGELYILAGHHRTVGAILAGGTELPAEVMIPQKD
jgi:ParB-like nuclease domain